MGSVPNHNHEYDDITNRFCFYFTRAGPTLGGLRFPIPAPVKSDFRVSSQSSFDFFCQLHSSNVSKLTSILGRSFKVSLSLSLTNLHLALLLARFREKPEEHET